MCGHKMKFAGRILKSRKFDERTFKVRIHKNSANYWKWQRERPCGFSRVFRKCEPSNTHCKLQSVTRFWQPTENKHAEFSEHSEHRTMLKRDGGILKSKPQTVYNLYPLDSVPSKQYAYGLITKADHDCRSRSTKHLNIV